MFSEGTVIIGTGNDDLREGSIVWVRIFLRDRPPVVFEAAARRRFPDRTDTAPIPWRLGSEHAPPVAISDVERITVEFVPGHRRLMEPDKWSFTRLVVTVNDSEGTTTLYSNVSVNHKFEQRGTWSSGLLPTFVAAGSTIIHVRDEGGRDVPGALVFIDTSVTRTSVLAGRTDAAGRLSVPSASLQPTSTILVRGRIHEQGYFRSNHNVDSSQNWNYRVYLTNVWIDDNGIAFPTLGPFGAVVDITLRRDNTLLGLNFLLSAEWDLSEADTVQLENNLRVCSQFLYNATDGQFFIETAQVGGRANVWSDADYRVNADFGFLAHVPHSNVRGGFLGWNILGSEMNMSRADPGATYAHEFGHFGFAVGDEYRDGPARCTAAVASSTSLFRTGQPRTSCMMWDQTRASKICSGHASNPHVAGTRQGDEACWGTISRRYNVDARWNVRTPESRGAIPGQIRSVWSVDPFASSFISPDIRRRRVANLPGLIGTIPLLVTDAGGAPVGGVLVRTHDQDGWIVQGRTSAGGTLSIAGIHRGDRLRLELSDGPTFEADIPPAASGGLVAVLSV